MMIIQLAAKVAETAQEDDLWARCLQSLGKIQSMLHYYNAAQEILCAAQTKFEISWG